MTRFNDEEFELFEFIVDKIISKKKNSHKDTFKNTQQDPTPHVDYVGETFFQQIVYGGGPFLLIFKKHLIDSNPKEKYEKSFMVRMNKFFDKDLFQTSFEAHPYRWRRNFQQTRIKAESSLDMDDKWNKEPFVKGISIQAYSGQYPINLYVPEDQDVDYPEDDENCTIYIQTNNIKKAKENAEKYFINIMVNAIDHKFEIDNKFVKKRIKEIEANTKKKKRKNK